MQLTNYTPFTTNYTVLMDREGAETLVFSVKATYEITQEQSLKLAAEQVPVNLSPEYYGPPATTSLRYDTDLVLEKPGTDCVLIGQAYAPSEQTREVDATFAVGSIRKTVRVFGRRVWEDGLTKPKISLPEVFRTIPLIYEHAFGGADCSPDKETQFEQCESNPVGKGFRAVHSNLEVIGAPLPHIEDPTYLIQQPNDRPPPAGFGMVAPFWYPRKQYAGTYDADWQQHVSPLLPNDFNPQFFCAASLGLTTPTHLEGNETVYIENACDTHNLQFQLPAVTLQAVVNLGGSSCDVAVKLFTLLVEPDLRRIILCWGGALMVHNQVYELRWLRIKMK